MLTIRAWDPKDKDVIRQLEIESARRTRYAILENKVAWIAWFGVKTRRISWPSLSIFRKPKIIQAGSFWCCRKTPEANLKSAIPGGPVYTVITAEECLCCRNGFMCSRMISEALKQADTLFNKVEWVQELLDALYDEIYPVILFKQHWISGSPNWFEQREDRFGNTGVPSGTRIQDALFDMQDFRFTSWMPGSRWIFGIDLILRQSLTSSTSVGWSIYIPPSAMALIPSKKWQAAADGGFKYLGHGSRVKVPCILNGLTIERLEERWQTIDRWNNTNSLVVLKGIECDIWSMGAWIIRWGYNNLTSLSLQFMHS